jgi:ssDNA-binding Zn-finger/Zn-ribbon topoisomerase 1
MPTTEKATAFKMAFPGTERRELAEKVINEKGLSIKSRKSQLPFVIQALFKLVVPSTKEVARLNAELYEGQVLRMPADVTVNGVSRTVISLNGYADVTVLRTLFYIFRLFYKQIYNAKKNKLEPVNEVYISRNLLIKEFELTSGGSQYRLLIKHLKYLANCALVENIDKTGDHLGLQTLYTKDVIEGLIKLELVAVNEASGGDALDILANSKEQLIRVRLNDFLFNELSQERYRLIDLDLFGKKLKSNLARIIYAYVIFHSQTNYKISLKKLCSKLVIKYDNDPKKIKHLRSRIKEALEELKTASSNTVTGEIVGDCVCFGFDKQLILAPLGKEDWGLCPKCHKGRVVSSVSKKNNQRYWYCNAGKSCDYVLDNEPKR